MDAPVQEPPAAGRLGKALRPEGTGGPCARAGGGGHTPATSAGSGEGRPVPGSLGGVWGGVSSVGSGSRKGEQVWDLY